MNVLALRVQPGDERQKVSFPSCIACHGFPPLGGPELAPNNPQLIKSAINNLVPAMSFLRGRYSDSQLADIAAYIASLQSAPPPPPPANMKLPPNPYGLAPPKP